MQQAIPQSQRVSRKSQPVWWLWLLCVVLFVGGEVLAHGGHDETRAQPVVLAPGYGSLEYEAPQPGSYSLPVLSNAADGAVLAADGTPTSLHALYRERVVVLSFVYASCSDVNGCPLATAVLHRLKTRLAATTRLAGRLQLVSLSFDPTRDTPAVMRRYGAGFAGPGPPWSFATTASPELLAPILEAYGQSVQPEYDEQGLRVGTLSHVLRVYLIDPEKRIRNIYSVSQLHADTLVADIRTLLVEEEPEGAPSTPSRSARNAQRDPRRGYSERSFTTRSVELGARLGAEVDLVRHARTSRPGYAPLAEPGDNPLSAEKVALGRRLFFDRRLSSNGTLSCAMCHVPEQGFTNNELETPVGTEGRTVRRNAPTLLDVGYRQRLFHDGRETRLEEQIWSPLLAKNEMANPSAEAVLEKIRAVETYRTEFDHAFPARSLTKESVGMALASYQRTLVSGPTPFDRWRYGGERDALSEEAKRGFGLFVGDAGCQRCHAVGSREATFEDGAFHNTGIGWERRSSGGARTKDVVVAPGHVLPIDTALLRSLAGGATNSSDLGRYEVSREPNDRGRFRTPSLRNVALTAPYMHDGSLGSLDEVIDHYRRGGVANPNLDPLMAPLELSEREGRDLIAFLEALTGDAVPLLVGDAFAAAR